MTEPTPPPAATPSNEWRPLPDAARRSYGLVGALYAALPLGIPGALALGGLVEAGWTGRVAVFMGVAAVAGTVGFLLGRLRWRRTRWRLDHRGLQVRRGIVWQSEVLVPRTRVQHLDLERGPIERRFGLATLVVHTAGTRLNALRQSGFLDADAVALRDALLPENGRDDDAL